MEKYLLRQHLLLTEKYQDCERSWRELRAFSVLPEKQQSLTCYLQPKEPLSPAAHWYLVAKENELVKNRVIKLSLFYPFVLIVLSLIVMSMVSQFVLPEFEAIYFSSDTGLPSFSQFILSHIEVVITFIAYILLLILGFSLTINSKLKKLKPISARLKLLIVFTPWINLHNLYCASIKLSAWHLVKVVIHREDLDGLLTAEEFNIASQTDNLKETLDFASPNIDPYQLMLMNQRLNTLITLFLGVIIGAFIIAVYLPIFSLGQVF